MVWRLDGRPFRTRFDVRFDVRFDFDLTSVSISIWRPFQNRFDVGFAGAAGYVGGRFREATVQQLARIFPDMILFTETDSDPAEPAVTFSAGVSL